MGIIDISNVFIETQPKTNSYKQFCFEIHFYSNENNNIKQFLLCSTENQLQKEQWVEVLLKASKLTKTTNNSIKEVSINNFKSDSSIIKNNSSTPSKKSHRKTLSDNSINVMEELKKKKDLECHFYENFYWNDGSGIFYIHKKKS